MIYAYFFEKIGRLNAVVGINVYLVRFFKKMLYSVLVVSQAIRIKEELKIVIKSLQSHKIWFLFDNIGICWYNKLVIVRL